MVRATPNPIQNFLSSVVLPLLSLALLPISLTAVGLCIAHDRIRHSRTARSRSDEKGEEKSKAERCVMISGGRMSKGLTLARAFKCAGWTVIGVEEKYWGELCPMRFSSAIDHFYILPSASSSYPAYSSSLLSIARSHRVNLFIPVSGAGSSVQDAQAAEEMYRSTSGRCATFIQDKETMLDLHDKDRFMALVERVGLGIPRGKRVESVEEAMGYLRREDPGGEPTFVLKCMGLDENRGDMTLFPLRGDDKELGRTRGYLEGLKLKISTECPYVFQEFIPGQEYCTHASVIDGRITSFVACPSNDMLMTYENITTTEIGRQCEEWTRQLLTRLQNDPTPSGESRRLTGHFSFDLILSTKNGQLYPIECNARVHTAVILLPLDGIASCYSDSTTDILRPYPQSRPRTWWYNDLIMRYLPRLASRGVLGAIHPSLPACAVSPSVRARLQPDESAWRLRVDPTLVADDWLPFLVLWHVWWPVLLVTRWWEGKKWTRLNVSTGRIFEA